MTEKNNELLIKNHQSRLLIQWYFQKQMQFLKIIDEDIIIIIIVDMVVAVVMDAAKVVIIFFHKTIQFKRNIMRKRHDKGKDIREIFFPKP